MEVGIDFVTDKKTKEKNAKVAEEVVGKCHRNGLHLVYDHESNIQIMPPLTTNRGVLIEGLEILVDSVKSF